MPAKNRIKSYVAGGYYHIYNRGVEKRKIFLDPQDYSVYLSYLKTYLLPKDEDVLKEVIVNKDSSGKEKDKARKLLRMNNFFETATLKAYVLMPNHFHLLIHQKDETTIDAFMNSLSTRYSLYFNKKYKRVGPLFQGVYKAVQMFSDEQLLYLTRYIHRNPLDLQFSENDLVTYQYSSLKRYLNMIHSDWVKPDEILSFFSQNNQSTASYKDFVISNSHQENEYVYLLNAIVDELI